MAIQFNPSEHMTKLPRYTKDAYGNSVKVEDDYLEVKWRLVWFRSVYPHGSIETQEMCVDLDREVTAERTKWVNKKKETYTVSGRGYARYKAIVTTGEGGSATGTKSESAVDFPDFCEKAETGAIGRALAALGFGTQFTGDELEEARRIVDSPIKPATAQSEPTAIQEQPPTAKELFKSGREVGMWIISSDFYQEVSRLLAITCTKDTVLSLDQRQLLSQIIETGTGLPVDRPNLTVVPTSPEIELVVDGAAPQGQAISKKQIESIQKLSAFLERKDPDNLSALTYAQARQIIADLTSKYKATRLGSYSS